ncbi:MAG: outer membrane protein assembly factor BamD [Rhodospirillales bacterium]|nr:outer membrane protein assembly factor BamD [Rhodospirillales bacterium]
MNSLKRPTVYILSAVFAITFLISGCSDTKKAYVERSVEELYNDAQNKLQGGKNNEAASLFEEVERQHPYSMWATKSQLMAAFSYYKANKYEDATVALRRYIRLHPSNRDIAYAHYLLALSYYEQISDVTRDQKMTQQAVDALKVLITRFPNSKYARDAKLKLDLTFDHLAGKEMEIGRYYLRWRQYLAAINRFRAVVENYQTTSHTAEALHRLAESYTALGMISEAQKVAAVLGHNFPGSEWYQDSYGLVEEGRTIPTEQKSWWKVWQGDESKITRESVGMPKKETPWWKIWE